jgi:hypothetical protein
MNRKITRREFSAAAAVTAVAGALPAAAAQPEQKNPEAQNLHEMLRTRYGKHLDAEQLQALRAQIESQLRGADRLRKFPVGQDDPAFVFQADI